MVEMLVVFVIIAILAAIVIPIFLRQREKAWQAEVQSILKDGALAVLSYSADAKTELSDLDTATNPDYLDKLRDVGFTVPDSLDYFRVVADDRDFCLEASHEHLPAENEWKLAIHPGRVAGPVPAPDTCT